MGGGKTEIYKYTINTTNNINLTLWDVVQIFASCRRSEALPGSVERKFDIKIYILKVKVVIIARLLVIIMVI